MRVSISYPPIPSEKGVPLLAQNRQFQWFHNPTYIYPMVPSYAASLLKRDNFETSWVDGIASEWTVERYLDELQKLDPDVVAVETKTPVVKYQWKIVDRIKERLPRARLVLMGDHVTAMPEESFLMCKVDHVLTGGDYDFLLRSLCCHLAAGTPLEPGIWSRNGDSVSNTGQFKLDHNLNDLPFIDRDLTQWKLYSEKNGNFKHCPGTYTMVGRDCWWGKCTFCSWTTLYPKYRIRRPELLADEIGQLIDRYHVKEVFDDSGSFPKGEWLRSFCNTVIDRGYNREISLGCNMRFGALSPDDYKLMARAGFRMVLFGVESANQSTLDRICKNLKPEVVKESCQAAKTAGLNPHITIMFGYPWESKENAQRTLDLGKYLLKKGYADTVQATIIIPYPGTPLFKESKANGWLRTEDWDHYDMREPVMTTPMSDEEVAEFVQGIYGVAFDPEFIIRKIVSIRSWDDVRFIKNAGLKVLGHKEDFSR
jgi:anaerobic magnesium-protoporphyrin IX monomethyl ester cyclase